MINAEVQMIDLPIVLDMIGGIRPSIGSKEFLAGHPNILVKVLCQNTGRLAVALTFLHLFRSVLLTVVHQS